MRVALACVAAIALPITAVAQPTDTPAASAPPPAQTPADPTQAPGETPPADTPAPDAPKADPAYGEQPDRHDTRDFPAPRGKDVIIVSYPERSKTNIATLAALGGGGLLLGAIGVYFNLDARSAADEVSAHSFTGQAWTADRQDAYDRAHSSSVAAGVLYGLGGGLLVATAIAYIVTEPEPETMVIHPHSSHASRTRPLVAPTSGGAVIGGAWSF